MSEENLKIREDCFSNIKRTKQISNNKTTEKNYFD
jgi:hypothetical protein